jgi:hypothetical protein
MAIPSEHQFFRMAEPRSSFQPATVPTSFSATRTQPRPPAPEPQFRREFASYRMQR